MASTPTTKSQVQAYRFVLRRMESALVRRDSVLLHDPMGSHKRATGVGVALACVALVGFLVWGLFGGKGSVPGPGSIVIGKDTGSVYVVTSDKDAQKRLIPMLNMASAKLLSMSQGGQGAPAPTTVKEAALAELPRGPRTGMVNAPTYLPDASNAALSSWGICDVGPKEDGSGKQRPGELQNTTVVGGVDAPGAPLQPDQSLYVQDQTTHQPYLVYVPHKGPNDEHVVKAPVDPSQTEVMDVYGLNRAVPRTISTNMLNAIPQAPVLQVPQQVKQGGGPATYMRGRHQTGDVVQSSLPGEAPTFYVLLPSGKQEISQGAAAVLHAAKNGSTSVVPVATNAITDTKDAPQPLGTLDSLPERVPHPVPWSQAQSSCLSWKLVNGKPEISATLPGGERITPQAPVALAQSDRGGPQVDNFFMPAGKAAVTHSTSNASGMQNGPLGMVSDQGVYYGIKDSQTAQGLGLTRSAGDAKPAPAWLTRVLPRGAFLDPGEASYAYDSIPVPPSSGVNRPLPKKQ